MSTTEDSIVSILNELCGVPDHRKAGALIDTKLAIEALINDAYNKGYTKGHTDGFRPVIEDRLNKEK